MTAPNGTHPQPHEQLLMGWIAGGMMTNMKDEVSQEDQHNQHLPLACEPLLIGQIAGADQGPGRRWQGGWTMEGDEHQGQGRQATPKKAIFFFSRSIFSLLTYFS